MNKIEEIKQETINQEENTSESIDVYKRQVPSIGDAAMQYKNFALIVKKSEVLNINEVITLE